MRHNIKNLDPVRIIRVWIKDDDLSETQSSKKGCITLWVAESESDIIRDILSKGLKYQIEVQDKMIWRLIPTSNILTIFLYEVKRYQDICDNSFPRAYKI